MSEKKFFFFFFFEKKKFFFFFFLIMSLCVELGGPGGWGFVRPLPPLQLPPPLSGALWISSGCYGGKLRNFDFFSKKFSIPIKYPLSNPEPPKPGVGLVGPLGVFNIPGVAGAPGPACSLEKLLKFFFFFFLKKKILKNFFWA